MSPSQLAHVLVFSNLASPTWRYYAEDMRFRHPLCAVTRAPHSRDAMLAILQWYRVLSPVLSVHVNHLTYDAEKNSAYLDITQVFHIRWSPFKPAPSRYVL